MRLQFQTVDVFTGTQFVGNPLAVFAPHLNIPEDPATGAAVALIGLLASLRPEANLFLSKTIAQGVEMGRSSILQAEADKRMARLPRPISAVAACR